MSVDLCFCERCRTVYAHRIYGDEAELFCKAYKAKTTHIPLPGLLETEP